MIDKYQERYLAHQERKRAQLMHGEHELLQHYTPGLQAAHSLLLENRRSQRIFNSEPIHDDVLKEILTAATYAPSSCNRHGIELLPIRDKVYKELLGGLLVGGVGWVHRADTIVLFMANKEAYKSPNEKEFMHYCDVGFTATYMWLKAESLGVGASYINPNIRSELKQTFATMFEDGNIFCGALALGYYNARPREADHPKLAEMRLL